MSTTFGDNDRCLVLCWPSGVFRLSVEQPHVGQHYVWRVYMYGVFGRTPFDGSTLIVCQVIVWGPYEGRFGDVHFVRTFPVPQVNPIGCVDVASTTSNASWGQCTGCSFSNLRTVVCTCKYNPSEIWCRLPSSVSTVARLQIIRRNITGLVVA